MLIILIDFLQKIGFGNKTYNIFRRKSSIEWKRKGHLLFNPTEDQLTQMKYEYLRKVRMHRWSIIDSTDTFPSSWQKRPEDIIDSIIIHSTDSSNWTSLDIYSMDTSSKNDVIYGKPLPGISCHYFINSGGIIEQTCNPVFLTMHTKGKNTRSISIMIQYAIKNNASQPPTQLMLSLNKLLVILCLKYKLNPYKAIKGLGECIKWPAVFSHGHTNNSGISPGPLVSMDEVRRNVAIEMKRRLNYAGLNIGTINNIIDSTVCKAVNSFNSTSLNMLVNPIFTKIKKDAIWK